MLAKLRTITEDRRGVTAIEYGLITALISVVIITALKAVGSNLSTVFDTIALSI